MATPGVYVTGVDKSFLIPHNRRVNIKGLTEEENNNLMGIYTITTDEELYNSDDRTPMKTAIKLLEKYKYHEFIVLQLEEFILVEI
jgi:hypothetical protein